MTIESLKVSWRQSKLNKRLELPTAFTKPSFPRDKNDISIPLNLKN